MNDDYQNYNIEDWEDRAIDKSRNAKKKAAIAAAALGLGGASAFAAHEISNSGEDVENDLSADNIMDVINAGEIDSEVMEELPEETQQEVGPEVIVKPIHHHHYHASAPEPHHTAGSASHPVAGSASHHSHVKPEAEHHEIPASDSLDEPVEIQSDENEGPRLSIEETGVVFDTEGNVIGAFDEGTLDGKRIRVMDTDANGRGDKVAYDENGNLIFDENEIKDIDNIGYVIGAGKSTQAYFQDTSGEIHHVGNLPDVESIYPKESESLDETSYIQESEWDTADADDSAEAGLPDAGDVWDC